MATAPPLTWDLDTLLPHPASEAFQERLQEFETDLAALVDRSEQLPAVAPEHAQTWADFLDDYQHITALATDLNAFIGCHAAAEAGNKLFLKYEARLGALGPQQQQVATNIDFALKGASDDVFEAFVHQEAQLKDIAFFLQERREHARLRLPKEQEILAAGLGVDGLHAWGRLYDRLSGGLRVDVMEKGELVQKSVSQVQFDSPERTVRENNFYASNRAWETIADTCADAINHIAGTRLTLYRHIGLEDHLEVPLVYNRMRRETLNTMWQTITDRKAMLERYFAAKAKLLGIDQMSWFDQTAPLPQAGNASRLEWGTACDLVTETFHGFSGEFGDFAEMALRDGWIEAENRSGKRQGGFCTGFPTRKQSRIFMTFTHSADSMSTLAHELGHAYHSHVLREQPLVLQEYPMGLAETASTFAEAVLGDQRLKTADTAEEKITILDHMLGDAVAFLMNIHARFLFEDRFHQERRDGEVATERLCELMVEAQREAYRNQLAGEGWNPMFWASKLHFYITGYPFYNFPYTFGYLLSLGVYAFADDLGSEFPERYKELLIATGCENAEEAVSSTLGADLTQATFWNRSLDIIQNRVDEYCRLADELV